MGPRGRTVPFRCFKSTPASAGAPSPGLEQVHLDPEVGGEEREKTHLGR